jgi:hypothetical protein
MDEMFGVFTAIKFAECLPLLPKYGKILKQDLNWGGLPQAQLCQIFHLM